MLVDFPTSNNLNNKNGEKQDKRIYEIDGHLNLLNKNSNNLKEQKTVVFNNLNKQQEKTKQNNIFCCCKCCGYRYIILLITALCLTSICSNMIVFNFTLILMKRPNWENETVIAINSTKIKEEGPFIVFNETHIMPTTVPYTQSEKAQLQYAVGIASIISTFPFSMLYTKYGARFVFLSAGILSTISTALLPFAASKGMAAFTLIRLIQGFAYGANFAAIGFVCHRWATLQQHGFFLACMTTFTSLSVTLTNPVAAFVIHALVSPILFGFWLFLYTDHPDTHPCVSQREKEQILSGKTEAEIGLSGFMPYRAIISNKIVLVVWLNSFADIVTAVFLITYLPTYVSKVLRYGVRETGIWSAVPALLHIPVKIGSGWLADNMRYSSQKYSNNSLIVRCMSEIGRMRLFNSIALVGSGIAFALVGFVPDDKRFLAVILMTINFALVSTNCGGFYKCATLISRQYAHFVVAGIQFEKSITLFVSPLIFLLFIRDESNREQWRNVFIGMAIILVVANTFFWFFVTDKPAEFTKIVGKQKPEKQQNIFKLT
uniref:MFS domain-containing protein n=1 Tax=Meloidogyne hapla TaxID=6305 RepID=A0A1I8B9G2_MELHA